MAKVFPDPVDRHGIHRVTLKSAMLVSYYPAEISESEIMYRLSGFCVRDGRGSEAVRDAKPMTRDVVRQQRSRGRGQSDTAKCA